MAQLVTYGIGGFDPSKPNNNIVSIEEIPDPPPPPKTAAEIAAEHATIETIADVEAFRAALEQLPERERRIILLRFFHHMSQTQIADELGYASAPALSRLFTQRLGCSPRQWLMASTLPRGCMARASPGGAFGPRPQANRFTADVSCTVVVASGGLSRLT